MAELYFKYLTDSKEWSKQSTLYTEGATNIICGDNCKNYNENVVKVTSIDTLTGEKITQIMPCEMVDGETLPSVEASGILMESGKLYFIEIEDLQGNVVFEYTRVYSSGAGFPHGKVHGICSSSKCAVEVPSYAEFSESIKSLENSCKTRVNRLEGFIDGHTEDIEAVYNDLQNLTEDFGYVKAEVYDRFAVLSVLLPSMSSVVTLPYPEKFNVENTFYLGCLWAESKNKSIIKTLTSMITVDVECDEEEIIINGLPDSAVGEGDRVYLKLLFVRAGL